MMEKITFKKVVYAIAWWISINPLISLANENPIVDIQTTQGLITVQLAADKTPVTAQNFLTYVFEDFYENTVFHRVVDGL